MAKRTLERSEAGGLADLRPFLRELRPFGLIEGLERCSPSISPNAVSYTHLTLPTIYSV